MNRIEAEVKARGMSVFARIDHAAGAAAVELSLRPTEVLIFGNAKGGTPLMQSEQTIGIDLPLKALVWQDAVRRHLGFLQRSRLACASAWPDRRRDRSRRRQSLRRAARRHAGGNDVRGDKSS